MPLLLQEDTTSYLYGPGGMLLEQIQDSGPTGTAYYYHSDQLGSVRALTDQAGTVVNTYAYDAYGNTTASSETVANPFRYAGEYQDAETGLYYLRARYYDPATQQFLTRDPLVAATEQAYNYAAGSPLNATDPSGLRFSINDEGGGGGAVDLGGAPGEGAGGAGAAAGAAAEEAAAEEALGEMGGWSEVQREGAIADEGELIQVGIMPKQDPRSGREIGAAGAEWEETVRRVAGGSSQTINGREIDCVTGDELIQAKDVNPSSVKNFLNKETRRQIKATISTAKDLGKRAVFWFKTEPLQGIRQYIEEHGGIVRVGLGGE